MIAAWALIGLGLYLGLGLVFGLAFIIKGAPAIDPAARGAGWGFRLTILPGAAALWPVLLAKWLRTGRAAELDN